MISICLFSIVLFGFCPPQLHSAEDPNAELVLLQSVSPSKDTFPWLTMSPLPSQLWRHGDRSPVGTFPTDTNQEDKWPQGWGQLSAVRVFLIFLFILFVINRQKGMAQHVRLGKKLRQRYIEQLGFMGEHYKNHEIYVRSTDVNRTLISAISVAWRI